MIKIKPKFIAFLVESNFNTLLSTIIVSIILLFISFTNNNYFLILVPILITLIVIYNFVQSIIEYKKTELIIDSEKQELIYKTGNLIVNQENKTKITNIVIFSEYKNILLYYLFNTLNIEISLSNSTLKTIKIPCIYAKDVIFLQEKFFGYFDKEKYDLYIPTPKSLLLIFFNELTRILIYLLLSLIILIFLYKPNSTSILIIIGIILINLIFIFFKLINAYLQIFKTKLKIYTISESNIEFQIYSYEKFEANLIEIKKTFFKSTKITDIYYNQNFKEKLIGIQKILISFVNTPDSVLIENFDVNFKLKKITYQNKTEQQITQEIYQELRPNKLRFLINLILKANLAIIITILGFLISSFFLTIVPGFSFLFILLQEFIEMITTKYYISKNKIISKNNFLILKENIADKNNITSVRISQDILDKLMNTVSIYFYTKGSSGAIKFLHVNITENTILALSKILPTEYINKFLNISNTINSEICYTGQKHFINYIIYEIINVPAFITIIPSIALYSFIFENSNIKLFIIVTLLILIYYFFLYINNYLSHHKSKLHIHQNLIIHEYGFLTKITKIIKKENISEIKIETYPIQKLKILEIIPEGKSELFEQNNSNNFFLEINYENNIIFMFLDKETKNIKKDINKYIFESNNKLYSDNKLNKFTLTPHIKTFYFRLLNPINLILNFNFLLNIIRIRTTRYLFQKKLLIEKYKFIIKTNRIIPYNKISNMETFQDFSNKYFNTKTIIISPHASNHNIILWDLKDTDSEYTYNLLQNLIEKNANQNI